jgi:hypothetical protein
VASSLATEPSRSEVLLPHFFFLCTLLLPTMHVIIGSLHTSCERSIPIVEHVPSAGKRQLTGLYPCAPSASTADKSHIALLFLLSLGSCALHTAQLLDAQPVLPALILPSPKVQQRKTQNANKNNVAQLGHNIPRRIKINHPPTWKHKTLFKLNTTNHWAYSRTRNSTSTGNRK